MEKMQDEAVQLSHILHSTHSNFKVLSSSVVEGIVTTEPKSWPQQELLLYGHPAIGFTKALGCQADDSASALYGFRRGVFDTGCSCCRQEKAALLHGAAWHDFLIGDATILLTGWFAKSIIEETLSKSSARSRCGDGDWPFWETDAMPPALFWRLTSVYDASGLQRSVRIAVPDARVVHPAPLCIPFRAAVGRLF